MRRSRRRSKINASSLDLFLDTICNAFGGIMFLSILIAVLAQLRDSQQSTEPVDEALSQSDVDDFSHKLDELQSERQRVLATIESLEKLREDPNQSEVLELKKQVRQANLMLDQAIAEQSDVSRKLSEVQLEVTNRKREAVELEEKLVAARAAYLDKAKAIEEALASHEQKTEIPVNRESNKANLLFAMRYGKLYLISDPNDPASSNYNTNHAIITKTTSTIEVKPRREAGWDLAVPTNVSQFEFAIANRSPNDTFLSIAVWPDSFKEFARFKEICLRIGYDYQLIPLSEIDSVSIGAGGTANVQ